MTLSQRISEHRSTIIMIVLVALSLASLATGNRTPFIRSCARTVVSVVAHPFLKVINGIEGGLDYITGLVLSYNATVEESRMLRHKLGEATLNATDRKELVEENKRLRRMMRFERNEPRLTLEPVEVIERFEGKLVIDRGSRHGIRESMVAITPDGVVGMVIEVGLFTSSVLTLNDADCNIAAMSKRNRVRGIVRGTGGGKQICRMQYIDLKDEVHEGDKILTSPESVFPSGYLIGTISDVDNLGTLQKTADIIPAVDPGRLDELLILKKAETSLVELVDSQVTDRTIQHTLSLPEDMSQQEQYAP